MYSTSKDSDDYNERDVLWEKIRQEILKRRIQYNTYGTRYGKYTKTAK